MKKTSNYMLKVWKFLHVVRENFFRASGFYQIFASRKINNFSKYYLIDKNIEL